MREITEMARAHGPEALAVIVRSLGSSNERIALAAAIELMNRAYGRAPIVFDDAEGIMTIGLAHLIAARSIAAELQEAFLAGRSMPPPDERGVLDLSNPNAMRDWGPALE